MKYIQIILVTCLLLILHYAVFYTIPNQFAENNLAELQRIIINRRIYLVVIMILSLFAYRKYLYLNPKFTNKIKAIIFSIVISFNVFYAVELFFSFKAKSHAIGYSYAGKIWNIRYWKPINANGFRDIIFQHNFNNKTIFFIGDSFTEGHGIENIEDRYSDIIRNALPNYNVYNLGINGIGTKKETTILTLAEIKPNIAFWQYFFNDIDELLQKYGYNFSFTPYNDINTFIQKIVKGSFFFNYIYWSSPHKDAQSYLDGLENGCKNKDLMKEHLQDCDAMINYCADNNIKLVFIGFPLFVVDDNNIFNKHNKFMLDYFASKSIATVDVNAITKNLTTKQKVVNNFDMHASKLVNKKVAEYILKHEKF